MTIIKLNIKQLKKLLVVGMVFSAVLLVAPVSSNAAANNPTLTITATTTGADTTFNYAGNVAVPSITTVNGSGSTSAVALTTNTLYVISQTNALLPFPTVTCTGAAVQVINATVTFTPTANEDIACTFAYADPNPTTTTTTTTTTAPAVQGTSVSAPPSVAVQGTSVSGLPVTGYQSEFLTMAAVVLLATGAMIVISAKKRTAKTSNIA